MQLDKNDPAVTVDPQDYDYDLNQDIPDHTDAQKNYTNQHQTTIKMEQEQFQCNQTSSPIKNENVNRMSPSTPINPNSIELLLPSYPLSTQSININFDLSSLPYINLDDNTDSIKHKKELSISLNRDNIINVNKKYRRVRIKKRKNTNYICTYHGCNYSTPLKGNIKNHSVTHSNERPFACPKCGKKFKRKQGVSRHLISHSPEKPYICPYIGCNKRFRRKWNLGVHIKLHSGGKPYKCTYLGCHKSYITPGILKLHIMNHTGMRPYGCTYQGCNKRYKTNWALRNTE